MQKCQTIVLNERTLRGTSMKKDGETMYKLEELLINIIKGHSKESEVREFLRKWTGSFQSGRDQVVEFKTEYFEG